MEYNEAQIRDLIDKLDGLGTKLTRANEDVATHVNGILEVLDPDSHMYPSLQTAQKNLSEEFSNTVTTVLANLKVGAENALGNAQYADVKVADSFAGM